MNRTRTLAAQLLFLFAAMFVCEVAGSHALAAADGAKQETVAPSAASSLAKGESSATTRSERTLVTVGVYVNQMPMMSLKENKFQWDFYIWFRWRGKLAKAPFETFELANGKIESRQLITNEVKDGENYAVMRCLATVTQFWDVRRFPFDNHDPEIEIEDSLHELDEMAYVADTVNSKINPDLHAPGWVVVGGEATALSQVYKTNYGDRTLPTDAESEYSRFRYAIHLERSGLGVLPKLFFPLWVAVALALLSLYILPSETSPRFGFAASAVFASVGAMYAISANLPVTPEFTIAERVYVLTLATVFLSLTTTVYSCHKFKTTGKLADSLKIDRRAVIAILIFFLFGNAAVFVF
jgi:hypothetical protein